MKILGANNIKARKLYNHNHILALQLISNGADTKFIVL
tara:strand:+ start:170 stop:283 length:114 start_codon:yes stop_codon:yes gene_type:complete